MPHRNKSREEIAQQFWVTKADIKKLLVCSQNMAKWLFDEAKSEEARSTHYSVGEINKVRLKSVLLLADISEAELENKLKPRG